MMAKRRLIGATKKRKARCTPFCFRKKGGMQRLVLDCRIPNPFFRHAPFTDLGAAEGLSGVRIPPSAEWLVASGIGTYVGSRMVLDTAEQFEWNAITYKIKPGVGII